VRRVFVSTSAAPTYAYDPYGNPLQATAPLTDFGYAGMFRHVESGLYLTQYRAYDPVVGRWLSRDPAGELSEIAGSMILASAADALGPTVVLMDSSGTIQTSYSDAPYNVASGTGAASDIELQLTRRYPLPDPLGVVSSANLYAYAFSSPTIHTDPDGRFALPIIARIAIGAAAGFAIDAAIQYAICGSVSWGTAGLRGGLIGAGIAAPHWWWS
jgi:RHS repeat-associated protein